MKPKFYLTFSMLFCLLIVLGLSSCQESPPLSPTNTTTQTIVQPTATNSLTLWLTETIQPLPTSTSTLKPTSTSPPISTPTPLKPTFQLTFNSDRNLELSTVFSIDIGCLDADRPCFSEPELLFEWNDWISGVDWSPDGNRIALSSGMYRGELYISDWNGENALPISGKCENADWPKWSPDGSKVAYIYAEGKNDCEYLSNSQINVYEQGTGQISSILNNAFQPSRIDWLPSGQLAYIAMNSPSERIETIYIVEPNGNIIKQLPTNPAHYTHILGFTFSPDGQQVAFVGDIWPITGSKTTDIYVTSLDGNNVINLTNGLGINLAPTWSTTGDWIAFESNRSGDYEIYLIKPDGTGLIQITENPASDTDPAWRSPP
jgi:dipeptidyl aminopeptidase/acylaminoacyl peptidase